MSVPGLEDLAGRLPEAPVPFEGTEFPFPISEAVFDGRPDIPRLREQIAESAASDGPPHEASWVALVAAEAFLILRWRSWDTWSLRPIG